MVGGKVRYGINGVSHQDAATPLKLAEYFGIHEKVFKYDRISEESANLNGELKIAPM